MATTTNDRGYGRLINTITAALLHRDYDDYLRRDGWAVSAVAEGLGLTARGEFGISQHYSLANTTDQSIFIERPFRPNPAIAEGRYRLLRGSLAWGNPDPVISISSSPSSQLDARISGFAGRELRSGKDFTGVEAGARLSLATIPTGYIPMFLRVGIYAGFGSDALPTQYQFRMPTSSSIVGTPRGFYSAPVGEFGGTEYLEAYAEHDFGDIVWRWLGLPTYEGRGLELVATGGRRAIPAAEQRGIPPHRRPVVHRAWCWGGEDSDVHQQRHLPSAGCPLGRWPAGKRQVRSRAGDIIAVLDFRWSAAPTSVEVAVPTSVGIDKRSLAFGVIFGLPALASCVAPPLGRGRGGGLGRHPKLRPLPNLRIRAFRGERRNPACL
ncbi:MAG: hypothetical protein UZ07_CHB004000079, partial [Chlorobi bacterium OLB7]